MGRQPTAASARLPMDQLAARSIVARDLLPSFASAVASGASLYFPVGRHLTADGQELAADGLVDLLRAVGPGRTERRDCLPGVEPQVEAPAQRVGMR